MKASTICFFKDVVEIMILYITAVTRTTEPRELTNGVM